MKDFFKIIKTSLEGTRKISPCKITPWNIALHPNPNSNPNPNSEKNLLRGKLPGGNFQVTLWKHVFFDAN